MIRVHARCLTCLDRRFHYNKLNRDDYVHVKKGQQFVLMNYVSPFSVPKYYFVYHLIVNFNGNRVIQFIKVVAARFLERVTRKLNRHPVDMRKSTFQAEAQSNLVIPKHHRTLTLVFYEPARYGLAMPALKRMERRLGKILRSIGEVVANW